MKKWKLLILGTLITIPSCATAIALTSCTDIIFGFKDKLKSFSIKPNVKINVPLDLINRDNYSLSWSLEGDIPLGVSISQEGILTFDNIQEGQYEFNVVVTGTLLGKELKSEITINLICLA